MSKYASRRRSKTKNSVDRLRRGDTTVGAMILLALTLGIGFFIWAFALSWMGISFTDLTANLNNSSSENISPALLRNA